MKDWREFRKQGRRAYVIKHGVLLWGLSSAVIWALVMQYFDPSDPVWLRPLIAAAVGRWRRCFPLWVISWACGPGEKRKQSITRKTARVVHSKSGQPNVIDVGLQYPPATASGG